MKPTEEVCERCDGIGSVCLSCDLPLDDCECFDESEPCLCDKCMGSGRIVEHADHPAPAAQGE